MKASIQPFHGLLTEDNDKQISYSSPGILVCEIGAEEPPDNIAPWELSAQTGLVITVKGASAVQRDKDGWELTIKVAEVVYGNIWGLEPADIRPARLTLLRKNEERTPEGVPTGQVYWTIQFYNWVKFQLLIPPK